jgi:hypothetical protein
MSILAQVANQTSDWYNLVERGGFPTAALIAVIWGFTSGKVVPGRTADRAEKQADKLTDQYETVVLPLIHEALATIRDSQDALRESSTSTQTAVDAVDRINAAQQRMEEVVRRVESVLNIKQGT